MGFEPQVNCPSCYGHPVTLCPDCNATGPGFGPSDFDKLAVERALMDADLYQSFSNKQRWACDTCGGQRIVDCNDCSGTGSYAPGKGCDHCDDEGVVRCPECGDEP